MLGSQYFVMPSGGEVGEPCGISQQEAHAGGTPVIAHHQDGLQRTVSDRDFGDKESPLLMELNSVDLPAKHCWMPYWMPLRYIITAGG
jgi:hypothetical protein